MSSPSKRQTAQVWVPHNFTALFTMAVKTDWTSVGEVEITRRISLVAACCSSASSRSRFKRSNSSAEWLVDTCAVGALRASGLVLWRWPFARCPLYPQKRTCAVQLGVSAKGQKRTSLWQQLVRKTLHAAGRRYLDGCEIAPGR